MISNFLLTMFVTNRVDLNVYKDIHYPLSGKFSNHETKNGYKRSMMMRSCTDSDFQVHLGLKGEVNSI